MLIHDIEKWSSTTVFSFLYFQLPIMLQNYQLCSKLPIMLEIMLA